MSDAFYKFPHTFHLFDAGSTLQREDKVLSGKEARPFYERPVTLEEKVDGANIGFSLSEEGRILVQNRGNYVDSRSHPQYAPLDSWIFAHEEALFDLLVEGRILFGEWCYARHSLHYDRLPDWFLAFDIYDITAGKFLSRVKRTALLNGTQIEEVPFIGVRQVSEREVEHLLHAESALYAGPLEGIYLRLEEGGYLVQRAKVVRQDFLQAIDTHWSRSQLTTNHLKHPRF